MLCTITLQTVEGNSISLHLCINSDFRVTATVLWTKHVQSEVINYVATLIVIHYHTDNPNSDRKKKRDLEIYVSFRLL